MTRGDERIKLIEKQLKSVFDTSVLKTGYMVYAKHDSWDEGKAGFLTSVTEQKLIVQYHPRIGNVTNHFFISVDEVIEGKWEIRWSSDLVDVYSYIIPSDIAQEEEREENDS